MMIPRRPRWLDRTLDVLFSLLWVGILAATIANTIAN